MNDKKVEKMPNNIPPFVKFCCANVPAVFDDSLSYYEALCALWKYLQECIDVINNNALLEEEFIEKFNLLKDYVENYFNNLDVQEEINKKLDDMAEDGSLTALISVYLTPYINEMNDNINNKFSEQDETIATAVGQQNATIADIQHEVQSLASGSPAGVYASVAALTAADPDHSKIYVVTADGKWYYYNGSWTAGGTYQASGIVDDSVGFHKLTTDVLAHIKAVTPDYTLTSGTYINYPQLQDAHAEVFSTSSPIQLKKGETITLNGKGYQNNVSMITVCDENGGNRTSGVGSTGSTTEEYSYKATDDCYVMICSQTNDLSGVLVLSDLLDEEDLPENIDTVCSYVDSYNLPEYTTVINKYINLTDGSVVSYPWANYYATDFIEVLPLTMKISCGSDIMSNSDPLGVCFYDSDKTFISSVAYEQDTHELVIDEVPAGTKFIRFTETVNMGTYGYTIAYVSLKEILDYINQVASVPDGSIGYDELSDNVLDHIKAVTPDYTLNAELYINSPQLQDVHHSTYSTSDPIELKQGQTIRFKGQGYQTNVSMITVCDANGGNRSAGVASTGSNTTVYSYTATADCFVMICSVTAELSDVLLIKELVAKEDVPSNTTQMFAAFNKFGVVGDSLASGEAYSNAGGVSAYIDNYDYSWGQYIAKEHGMECINFSRGGMTTRSWLTNQYGLPKAQATGNKCNAYIISLGVNDALTLGDDYLGTSSDINVMDPSQNADTYYGNYGKIISAIKAIQPKAKIFLTTIPDTRSDYTDFNAAVRTIATLFTDVYLIDLASDSNISKFNQGFLPTQERYGHYNAIGYKYIGETFYDMLSRYMYQNNSEFEQIEFIGTNYSYSD